MAKTGYCGPKWLGLLWMLATASVMRLQANGAVQSGMAKPRTEA